MSEFVWTNKTYISEILTIIPSCSEILRAFQFPCWIYLRVDKASPLHAFVTNCKKGNLPFPRKTAQTFPWSHSTDCQGWLSPSQPGQLHACTACGSTACGLRQCPASCSTTSSGVPSPTANHKQDTRGGLLQSCMFLLCSELELPRAAEKLPFWYGVLHHCILQVTKALYILIHHSEQIVFIEGAHRQASF